MWDTEASDVAAARPPAMQTNTVGDDGAGSLTLDFVVFRVGGEGPVGEEVGEADARVLRLVHHIVPDSLHQPVHKLQTGRAQNLNHLVPLVDV